MDNLTWVTHSVQTILETYGGLSILIGTFLLGENVALATFALSAQGYIDPVKAIVFVFMGSLLADIFWFFVTEYILRGYYERRLATTKQSDTHKMLMNLVDKHFFWVLIFIKFLIGMRLFLTIYIVLKNRIPFHKKVMLDTIGTVIYFCVIFPIGWFFGKGILSATRIEQGFSNLAYIFIGVFAFTTLSHYIVIYILKKKFQEKNTPEIA